jgi:hypothetical protein
MPSLYPGGSEGGDLMELLRSLPGTVMGTTSATLFRRGRDLLGECSGALLVQKGVLKTRRGSQKTSARLASGVAISFPKRACVTAYWSAAVSARPSALSAGTLSDEHPKLVKRAQRERAKGLILCARARSVADLRAPSGVTRARVEA